MKTATIRPQMPINMKKEENSNLISQRKATKAESIIGKIFGIEPIKESTVGNNNQERKVKTNRIFP